MAGACGRVKLLPFWLRESAMCSLVQGTPSPRGLGTLTRTHPVKTTLQPWVQFSSGCYDQTPNKKQPEGGGFIWAPGSSRESLMAGRVWRQSVGLHPAVQGIGKQRKQCRTQLSPSFPFHLFWDPNPWGGAAHNKGEFSFLRTLWKLLA